jgi:DNA-binding CsgD family transcriptional regulator
MSSVPRSSQRPSARLPLGTKAPRTRNTRAGLILLDSSLNPIYCNSEALRIFSYPQQPARALDSELSESIRSIIGTEPDFTTAAHFVSGRRRYLCRTFVLEREAKGRSKPTFAITVERDRGILVDMLARFQLTEREVEAVRHLAEGLTSKEIAQRMSISPNTVKTFLRLIMIKMGVTTRSGVIGKLMLAAQSQ